MRYFVYILYSNSIDKYYIGYTSNIESRLAFHNSELNNIWSKKGKPWLLIATFCFDDKSSALKAEKRIKRMKSRKFIEDLIKDGKYG